MNNFKARNEKTTLDSLHTRLSYWAKGQTKQTLKPQSTINGKSFFASSMGQCWITLKHHQNQELQFILNNKCLNNYNLHNFWMHHNNNWIQETCDQSNLDPDDRLSLTLFFHGRGRRVL
ncbi:hypothetical protein VP01_1460g8 [Puccinia sorghi]|uniref:Uncharacterized protein n=1 Tax=Puccinia sorghi TaxID=27349 RepID=A0A0L6VLP9_9BASI|nr:hypothetical protein VP01_1460g8 [Puccinia sorghi]